MYISSQPPGSEDILNPVIEAINNRRSIRAYDPKPIPKDIINKVIEAGNQAPSQGRMVKGEVLFQPWRFVVVEDPAFKQELVQTTLPIWSARAHTLS